MMLYFLRGRLPWHGVRDDSKQQRDQQIMDMKATISPDELCKDVPEEFKEYMNQVRSLGFSQRPDYRTLQKIFRRLFARRGFEHDYVFDWTILKFMESLPQSDHIDGETDENASKAPQSKRADRQFKHQLL